jgi:hypothetical protein
MSNKSRHNTEQNDAITDETIADGGELDNNETNIVDLPVNHFTNIVLSGKGRKLTPKTENHVFYEVVKHDEDNRLYLRLSGNEGGGLHSKEWILLQSVFELLDQQSDNPTSPFKSLILKPLFRGRSVNNIGLLASVLRSGDIGLLKPAEKGVFLHLISDDYEANKAKLLSLGGDQ